MLRRSLIKELIEFNLYLIKWAYNSWIKSIGEMDKSQEEIDKKLHELIQCVH